MHYGLDVLAENIEDNPGNMTRFAVIGDEPAPRTGSDKTALMFEIEHRPGALADAMTIFKRNRLNLTWIESFPIARGRASICSSSSSKATKATRASAGALQALAKKTLRLEVLGSYAKMAPVE